MNLENSRGVVFLHTKCKNQFRHLKGEEREDKLRELYVKLLDSTPEKANQKFNSLSEAEKQFQDNAIMNDALWPNAKLRGECAMDIIRKQFGIQNVEICEDFTKFKIDEKLKELKKFAAEMDAES